MFKKFVILLLHIYNLYLIKMEIRNDHLLPYTSTFEDEFQECLQSVSRVWRKDGARQTGCDGTKSRETRWLDSLTRRLEYLQTEHDSTSLISTRNTSGRVKFYDSGLVLKNQLAKKSCHFFWIKTVQGMAKG